MTKSQINDDDLYVYWESTKILAAKHSGKGPRPIPLPGQVVATGLQLKLRDIKLK